MKLFIMLCAALISVPVLAAGETETIKIDGVLAEDFVASGHMRSAEEKPLPKNIKDHWSGLPFFGKQAREKGIEIEPPFVVAYHFEHQSQYVRPKQGSLRYKDIETDVGKTWGESIGLGDAFKGLVNIDTLQDGRPNIYIETGKAKERTTTSGLRAGVWIFPFMQVYGIYNEIEGKSVINARSYTKLSGPLSGMLSQSLIDSMMPGAIYHGNGMVETNDRIEILLDSKNFGGGVTLAGGYKKFFTVLDMNYTYTKFDFSNDYTHTFVISPRVGYDMKLFDRPLRIWTGFMGQYVSSKVTGRLTALHFNGSTGSMVPLINPNGTAGFEVRQKLVRPINYIIGGRYTITPHVALMIEGGYAGSGGRKSVLSNIEFMF